MNGKGSFNEMTSKWTKWVTKRSNSVVGNTFFEKDHDHIAWLWRPQRIFLWLKSSEHGDVTRVPYINTRQPLSSETKSYRSQVCSQFSWRCLTCCRRCLGCILAGPYLLPHSILCASACAPHETELPWIELWLQIPCCFMLGNCLLRAAADIPR